MHMGRGAIQGLDSRRLPSEPARLPDGLAPGAPATGASGPTVATSRDRRPPLTRPVTPAGGPPGGRGGGPASARASEPQKFCGRTAAPRAEPQAVRGHPNARESSGGGPLQVLGGFVLCGFVMRLCEPESWSGKVAGDRPRPGRGAAAAAAAAAADGRSSCVCNSQPVSAAYEAEVNTSAGAARHGPCLVRARGETPGPPSSVQYSTSARSLSIRVE